MIDYVGYKIARLLSKIFTVTPLYIVLTIGRLSGTIAFYINRKRRKVAYCNLKAAFCASKKPNELMRIVKKTYQNLGMVLAEVLKFPVIDKGYVDKYIQLNGYRFVEQIKNGSGGGIFLTAHFGNWELTNLIAPFFGVKILALAREQKHTKLNELLNEYRELTGSEVVKKGYSIKRIIKHLRCGGFVGILTDQDAGKFREFVDFFGRPVSMHKGAFEFSESTGAKILPVFIVRKRGPYHCIDILGELDTHIDSIALKDVKDKMKLKMQTFARLLETYVRGYPHQWLWLHKRWKSTPKKYILILDDGKIGHLNQSIAVADLIKSYRKQKGFSLEDTYVKIVKVKFKDRFSRFIVGLCGVISSSRCQGCLECLGMCLEEESYNSLLGSYADIIISAGSSLAALNLILSKENGAKSVCLMRPGIISTNRFDLVILPRHDRPKPHRNILITEGTPNLVNDGLLSRGSKMLSEIIGMSLKRKIGLLLGGDNPYYKMSLSEIEEVSGQIIRLAEDLDLEILVSTSRRTPVEVERLLKDKFGGCKRCRLLVIANEKNIEGVVYGILGLSDVVVVSGESSSMVSESASSGKYVVVFPLQKKRNKKTRHKVLLDNLRREGYIHLTPSSQIYTDIKRLFDTEKISFKTKRLDDSNRIFSVLGRLF